MSFLTDTILPGLPQPVARIVHIGAGEGSELSAYLKSGAAEILLVEADAEAAAALSMRAGGQPRVRVLRSVVSADTAPRPFHRMNFRDLSALGAPAPLMTEMFPGLRILSQNPATPAEAVGIIAPPGTEPDPAAPDGARLLVLEAPGESLDIIAALKQAGRLFDFDAIVLREGVEPLYKGAAPLAAIRDTLAAAGFETLPDPDPEEPERPWLAARLDRRLRRFRHEAETRAAELAASAERLAAVTADRDAARAALAETEKKLAAAEAAAAELEQLKGAETRATEAEAALKSAEARLLMSRDELLKAEGQIALIRELLLNGPPA